ncbi:MAG: hypothetical protein HY854_17175 [Burkholderiales bacterium]|nr:hypothetical protein [Burkholderiales bacterium]
MTQLRDARLRRALDSAPDGEVRPPDAVRLAVRDAARAAVAAAAPQPWWKRWWPQPQQRMPWNAAFATVLVAVLVGVMWQGEEVPDAPPEAVAVRKDQRVPAAPASPVASVAAVPPPAAAQPKQSRELRQLPAKASQPESARNETPEASLPPPPAELAKSAAAERSANRARESESLARRDQAGAAADAVATAPTPAAAPPAPVIAAASPPPAAVRPPPPAAAPAPAAAMGRMAAAPAAPAARSESAAQFAPSGERLRIEADGRAAVVQSPRLLQLAEQMARRASSDEPLASPVLLKIEMRGGVLEITGDQVRWTAPGQAPRTARPDVGLLHELRDEAARAMR